jgi:hypothetical protein
MAGSLADYFPDFNKNVANCSLLFETPPMSDQEPKARWLTPREVQKRLRITPSALRRWRKIGLLPGRVINSRVIRYREIDVRELESGKAK